MILVFVKNDFKAPITNLFLDQVAVGVGNVLGNKGAVIISFKIYET